MDTLGHRKLFRSNQLFGSFSMTKLKFTLFIFITGLFASMFKIPSEKGMGKAVGAWQ